MVCPRSIEQTFLVLTLAGYATATLLTDCFAKPVAYTDVEKNSATNGGTTNPGDWKRFNPYKFQQPNRLVPLSSVVTPRASLYSHSTLAFPNDPTRSNIVYGRGPKKLPTIIYAKAFDLLQISNALIQAPAAGESKYITIQGQPITIYGTSVYTPLPDNSFVANPAQISPFDPANVFYRRGDVWPSVVYGEPGQEITICNQRVKIPPPGQSTILTITADGKVKPSIAGNNAIAAAGRASASAKNSANSSAASASNQLPTTAGQNVNNPNTSTVASAQSVAHNSTPSATQINSGTAATGGGTSVIGPAMKVGSGGNSGTASTANSGSAVARTIASAGNVGGSSGSNKSGNSGSASGSGSKSSSSSGGTAGGGGAVGGGTVGGGASEPSSNTNAVTDNVPFIPQFGQSYSFDSTPPAVSYFGVSINNQKLDLSKPTYTITTGGSVVNGTLTIINNSDGSQNLRSTITQIIYNGKTYPINYSQIVAYRQSPNDSWGNPQVSSTLQNIRPTAPASLSSAPPPNVTNIGPNGVVSSQGIYLTDPPATPTDQQVIDKVNQPILPPYNNPFANPLGTFNRSPN